MAKSQTVRRKTPKPVIEPRLGIFWLVDGKLLIESTPLSQFFHPSINDVNRDYRAKVPVGVFLD